MSDEEIIHASSLSPLASCGLTRLAVAIGVFDGLHIGHQQIMRNLLTTANRFQATPAVLTFEPHPLQILNPEIAPARILGPDYQQLLLERMGIQALISIPFNRQFAQLEPEDFVREFLAQPPPEVAAVCVGENWRFGRDACGDAARLAELGEVFGFELQAVPEVQLNHQKVSATDVRQAITAGELARAEALLGRRFAVYGRVRQGRGIAAKDLNCATANVELQSEALPPCGIYAARAQLDGAWHPGILYLGQAPTYPDAKLHSPSLEVHLLDWEQDLYGQALEVEFLDFIREDRKFSSSDALREQIADDIAAARRIHDQRSNEKQKS